MSQNPDVRIPRGCIAFGWCCLGLIVLCFLASVVFMVAAHEPGCGLTVAGLDLPWPCSWAYWWTR